MKLKKLVAIFIWFVPHTRIIPHCSTICIGFYPPIGQLDRDTSIIVVLLEIMQWKCIAHCWEGSMKVDDFFLVFNSNWAGALPKAEPPFKNPGPATGLYTKQAVACEIY